MTEPDDELRHQRTPKADDGQELEVSDVVEGMPEEVKDAIIKRVVRTEASFYRAPIPPPDTLQGYENVVEGSAKQILDQAKAQTHHRMQLERKTVEAGIKNSRRGQWFGFIIAMAVIGVGALAVFTGAGLISLGLILPGLAALVGVFIYSQRQQQGQLQESRDAFPAAEEPPSALRSAIEQARGEGTDRQK